MTDTEKRRHFKNRKHAGIELGNLLKAKYGTIDPLVFGVPRGGVEVAYYVASAFDTRVQIIVSKKLPLPSQPEFGIGAVSEENSIYVSSKAENLVSPEMMNEIIDQQQIEVERRVNTYRHGRPLPDMDGRIVFIVDDGIATGVTLVPVVKLCRKKNASKIIIAAPVSGMSYNEGLYAADAIEVLIQPVSFYAVGQVYEYFGDFNDDQLMALMDEG